MVATKEDRAGVPLGNIQAEPFFVVRLIGRAFVSLEKQFLYLPQRIIVSKAELLYFFFCQARQECVGTMRLAIAQIPWEDT